MSSPDQCIANDNERIMVETYRMSINEPVIQRQPRTRPPHADVTQALHPWLCPIRVIGRRAAPDARDGPGRDPRFSGRTAMAALDRTIHHRNGSRASDTLGPPPNLLRGHSDGPDQHVAERPWLHDHDVRRALRLRLMLDCLEDADGRRPAHGDIDSRAMREEVEPAWPGASRSIEALLCH